jgi:hypothetical protein
LIFARSRLGSDFGPQTGCSDRGFSWPCSKAAEENFELKRRDRRSVLPLPASFYLW